MGTRVPPAEQRRQPYAGQQRGNGEPGTPSAPFKAEDKQLRGALCSWTRQVATAMTLWTRWQQKPLFRALVTGGGACGWINTSHS